MENSTLGPYFALLTSVFFNVLTNVGFNLSALNKDTPFRFWAYFAGALVFGLINSYFSTVALKDMSLQAFSAIFFSLTVVGLLISSLFFGEQFTVKAGVGMAFIIAGVVLVSLGNTSKAIQ